MRVQPFGVATLVTAATLASALAGGVSPVDPVALPVQPVVFGAPLPLDPPGDPAPPPGAPVPTPDQVDAVVTQLTDPNVACQNKTDLVTPGLGPDECATIDDHLNQLNARGYIPFNFVVTDIQPAPDNFAGATVAVAANWPYPSLPPRPVVLVNQGGHWLITNDTATALLDALWNNSKHRFVAPGAF